MSGSVADNGAETCAESHASIGCHPALGVPARLRRMPLVDPGATVRTNPTDPKPLKTVTMNPAKILALMFALTVDLLPGQAGNPTEAVNLLSPARWVAVGDGTALDAHEQGLRIHYTRKRGVAFGAAIPLPNSLPVDFRRLRIEADAPKGSMLLLSLRRDDGAVHSWPMRPGSEDGPLQFDLAAR